jgi:hypothetical protein
LLTINQSSLWRTKVDIFRLVEIRYGCMEVLDIDKELKAVGIYERAVFYGVEYI